MKRDQEQRRRQRRYKHPNIVPGRLSPKNGDHRNGAVLHHGLERQNEGTAERPAPEARGGVVGCNRDGPDEKRGQKYYLV